MTKLSVNLNKIAWLRNARDGVLPNLVEMAEICVNSGADGITVHPRSDMRHIRPDDVRVLKEYTSSVGVEFNIEGNPSVNLEGDYPGFLNIVNDNKPDQCTLVPDNANQLTSDHGWDLKADPQNLKEMISTTKLHSKKRNMQDVRIYTLKNNPVAENRHTYRNDWKLNNGESD